MQAVGMSVWSRLNFIVLHSTARWMGAYRHRDTCISCGLHQFSTLLTVFLHGTHVQEPRHGVYVDQKPPNVLWPPLALGTYVVRLRSASCGPDYSNTCCTTIDPMWNADVFVANTRRTWHAWLGKVASSRYFGKLPCQGLIVTVALPNFASLVFSSCGTTPTFRRVLRIPVNEQIG